MKAAMTYRNGKNVKDYRNADHSKLPAGNQKGNRYSDTMKQKAGSSPAVMPLLSRTDV